jgi:hypothetical protein
MTARSGDALSHVNFQARPDVVFDGDQLSQIRLRRTHRNIAFQPWSDWFCPYCMAGMSGAAGTNRAASFHLNIT